MEMTKQEKIKEGIHDIIGDCLIKIGCGDTGCPKAERLEEEAQEACIQSLLSYLHANDVVIKVEDNSYVAPCLRDSWEEIKQDMKEGGYTAWKPLL